MLILVSAPANKKVHSYTLAERYLRFFYRLAMLITANLLCKYLQNFRFKAHKGVKMPRVVQLRSFGENALEQINAWNRICFCFAGIALLYIITLITSMSCHQIRRTNYCNLALEDIDGKKPCNIGLPALAATNIPWPRFAGACAVDLLGDRVTALCVLYKTGCGDCCGHISIHQFDCFAFLHYITWPWVQTLANSSSISSISWHEEMEVQDIAMRFAEDLPYPSISNGSKLQTLQKPRGLQEVLQSRRKCLHADW